MYHVLHRHLAPRHPPCALTNLSFWLFYGDTGSFASFSTLIDYLRVCLFSRIYLLRIRLLRCVSEVIPPRLGQSSAMPHAPTDDRLEFLTKTTRQFCRVASCNRYAMPSKELCSSDVQRDICQVLPGPFVSRLLIARILQIFLHVVKYWFLETKGLEPLTFALQRRRSPS